MKYEYWSTENLKNEIIRLKKEVDFNEYYNAFLLGMISTEDFEKISIEYHLKPNKATQCIRDLLEKVSSVDGLEKIW